MNLPADAAIDAGGQGNVAAAEYMVRYDTTPPLPPVIQLAGGGNLSNDPRPEFIGTAELGSVVTLKDSDDNSIGSAVADSAGNWRIIPTVNLPSGSHQITATAVDSVGNSSQPSPPFDLEIDLIAPAKPSAASLVDGGNTTLAARPPLTGTAEPHSTVVLRDENGAIIGTGTVDASGIWVIVPTRDLSPGMHAITVRVTDRAGNESPVSDPFTFNRLEDDVLKPTNIVTPNGDGINDHFVIENIELYPNNTLVIFDKAGRVLYSVRGYKNEWDGKLNGVPLHEGTYYYVLVIMCLNTGTGNCL